MARRTPEQAKEMLESLSPEEREQVAAKQKQMQQGMADMSHLVAKLKPSADAPDAPVAQHDVMLALASAPIMKGLGEDESQLLGGTIAGDKAKEALSQLEDKLEAIGAFPKDCLNDLDECTWRNAVLLYWHLHKGSQEAFAATLPGELDHYRGGVNQFATKLVIMAQMLFPQQRWVQVTLAIAKFSALLANAMWSHDDEGERKRMADVLAEDGLPYPKLSLAAKAAPRESAGDEVTAGQHVAVSVELGREHAAEIAEGSTPPCNNPQGIYEAYWVYLEGVKEGAPNSLIQAKPLVVTGDVRAPSVSLELLFQAPPVAGRYHLRVHVTSTSVIGIFLTTDVAFTVIDDDVPDLE
jgi:hypothetical protein